MSESLGIITQTRAPDTPIIGSRGGHTYTEGGRRSYLKRQDKALAHAKEYYAANAETLRAKRMARYYRQKAAKTIVVSNPNDDKAEDDTSNTK